MLRSDDRRLTGAGLTRPSRRTAHFGKRRRGGTWIDVEREVERAPCAAAQACLSRNEYDEKLEAHAAATTFAKPRTRACHSKITLHGVFVFPVKPSTSPPYSVSASGFGTTAFKHAKPMSVMLAPSVDR